MSNLFDLLYLLMIGDNTIFGSTNNKLVPYNVWFEFCTIFVA